jgi:hypothetical protein
LLLRWVVSLKPAMSRDDMALGISKDRIGEAERFDTRI